MTRELASGIDQEISDIAGSQTGMVVVVVVLVVVVGVTVMVHAKNLMGSGVRSAVFRAAKGTGGFYNRWS